MMKIYFVTRNVQKLSEVKDILGEMDTFEIIHYDLELPEYQGSLEQIAFNKCKEAMQIVKSPIIVEDTSLTFNSLGGLQGPYIKDFIRKAGLDALYRMLADFQDKSAQAITTIAYAKGINQKIKLFQGTVHGTIVKPSSVDMPANFEPIFQPDGYDRTYAMMDRQQKNKMSHRYKAFCLLKEFLCRE